MTRITPVYGCGSSSSVPPAAAHTHGQSLSETTPTKVPTVGNSVPIAASQSFESWDAKAFAQPFCDFLTKNPTVFHAVDSIGKQFETSGYRKLSERDQWDLKLGGKYYVERNGSSLIAFEVGENYKPGAGVCVVAGHIDALTAKLKPISKLEPKAGFVQLGAAPYAGAFNSTWWDRDLGIAGRVIVQEPSGKHVVKLVDLHEPIARVPTLAPHFNIKGPFNKETQMVPIIGLEGPSTPQAMQDSTAQAASDGSFASKQPPRLVKAIANQLEIKDYATIKSWELELYDVQPCTIGGIDKEFIYGGRIDDKLCSWAAAQALIGSTHAGSEASAASGIIKCVALFDNEEIGSLLRQGAHGNFLPSTLERAVEALSKSSDRHANTIAQTYANSYLISADVTHSVNPNFLNAYLPHHYIYLNTGIGVETDANGNMTTDSVSTAILQRVADKCYSTLQLSQIRNDVSSGGTIGPMLSSATGIRAVDAGMPQLSMHSIRAATGVLDPGLGVKIFKGFYDYYEDIDQEFRDT